MKSIGNKITLAFATVLILSCLSFGLVAYNKAAAAVVGEVDKSLMQLAEEASKNVETHMETYFSTLEVMANRNILKNTGNYANATLEDKMEILKEETKRARPLNNLWF